MFDNQIFTIVLSIKFRYNEELSRELSYGHDYNFINLIFYYDDKKINIENKTIQLTAMQRDFIKEAITDIHNFGGKSIHLLDIENESLITLRGLKLYCGTSTFKFNRIFKSDIDSLKISKPDCSFIHSEEFRINYKEGSKVVEYIKFPEDKPHLSEITVLNKSNLKKILTQQVRKKEKESVYKEEFGYCTECGKKEAMLNFIVSTWDDKKGICRDCYYNKNNKD